MDSEKNEDASPPINSRTSRLSAAADSYTRLQSPTISNQSRSAQYFDPYPFSSPMSTRPLMTHYYPYSDLPSPVSTRSLTPVQFYDPYPFGSPVSTRSLTHPQFYDPYPFGSPVSTRSLTPPQFYDPYPFGLPVSTRSNPFQLNFHPIHPPFPSPSNLPNPYFPHPNYHQTLPNIPSCFIPPNVSVGWIHHLTAPQRTNRLHHLLFNPENRPYEALPGSRSLCSLNSMNLATAPPYKNGNRILELEGLSASGEHLIYCEWWSIPWVLYELDVSNLEERYEGADVLDLKIHYLELTKPPPPDRQTANARQVKFETPDDLLIAMLDPVSGFKKNKTQLQKYWCESFGKHLSHGALDSDQCARLMLNCHYTFDMDSLLKDMRTYAPVFANRESFKRRATGIPFVFEWVDEPGKQGLYRMLLADIWVLVRDLLGATFHPRLAFKVKVEDGGRKVLAYLCDIGLCVYGTLKPAYIYATWNGGFGDLPVIF